MNIIEQYENYIQNKFPKINMYPFSLEKKMPWIRFELGIPGINHISKSEYMKTVYDRAISIFENVNDANDDIFLFILDYGNHHKMKNYKKIKLFDRYLKDSKLKYKINIVKTNSYDEVEEEVTLTYILKCKISDLNYPKLLNSIAHSDFLIRPYISQSCYIINTTKNKIYHMYDDRGLDIFSNSQETIRDAYEKYNYWIFDYDRLDIDNDFETGLCGMEESIEEKQIREEKDKEILRQLEKVNISIELPHQPKHRFLIENKKTNSEHLINHLNKMGYSTSVQEQNQNFSIVTSTKTCQLFAHQVSIQSRLMDLIAKKFDVKYDGWDLNK